MMTQVESN